jgi:hypothetical protein
MKTSVLWTLTPLTFLCVKDLSTWNMITICNSLRALYMLHLPSRRSTAAPIALVASASTLHRCLDPPAIDVLSKLSNNFSVHCSSHTHDRYVAAINNTPPIAQARVERLPATRLRVRSHQSVKSSSSFGESREWSELLFHFERKIYWGSLLNFLMTTTTNWPYTT